MGTCPKCRAGVDGDVNVCPSCGARLLDQETMANGRSSVGSAYWSAGRVGMILAGFAMLSTMVLPWSCLPTSSGQSTKDATAWEVLEEAFARDAFQPDEKRAWVLATFMLGGWAIGLITVVATLMVRRSSLPIWALILGIGALALFMILMAGGLGGLSLPGRRRLRYFKLAIRILVSGRRPVRYFKLAIGILGTMLMFLLLVFTHTRLHRTGDRAIARPQGFCAAAVFLVGLVGLLWVLLPLARPGASVTQQDYEAAVELAAAQGLILVGCALAFSNSLDKSGRRPNVAVYSLLALYSGIVFQWLTFSGTLEASGHRGVQLLLGNVLLLIVSPVFLLGSGIVGLVCSRGHGLGVPEGSVGRAAHPGR